MRNGEWAKEVEGRHRLSLLSGIGAGTAVATPALDGIENAANLLSRLRNLGVVLLHPGKDLADVLSILLARIYLLGNHLGKVTDHACHRANFSVQLVQADLKPRVLLSQMNLKPRVLLSQLGKLARSIHDMIPENPREPFQRQRLICVRHGSP